MAERSLQNYGNCPKQRICFLQHCFVFFSPGRVDDTQENEGLVAGIGDVLVGKGRDIYHVPAFHRGIFAVDIHLAGPLKDVINLCAAKAVRQRRCTGQQTCPGNAAPELDAVMPAGVQEFLDTGVVACPEGRAIFLIFNVHAGLRDWF